MECRFENCNLSLCQVVGTGFQQVHFSDCKLSGVDFTASRDFLFSVQFSRCVIEYALFSRKKMKKSHFSDCRICECDFADCDLTEAVFSHCDLSRTAFYHTKLSKADMRTAFNFHIDPEENDLRQALFSPEGAIALLQKYKLVIG